MSYPSDADLPPRDFHDDANDPTRPARRPPSRGFTVTLDPDVARVFRGDASVNKALRLVMQLVQVVEGPGGNPPRRDAPAVAAPTRAGYQGSSDARGFQRKARVGANELPDAASRERLLGEDADDEGGDGEHADEAHADDEKVDGGRATSVHQAHKAAADSEDDVASAVAPDGIDDHPTQKNPLF